MSSATRFRWASAARSHVGLVREINEDSFLDQPARGLWAVADGMGGHALGDVASRMVIDSLNGLQPHSSLRQFAAAVRLRLQEVNLQLNEEAARRDVLIIGSTVVVLFACGDHCGFLWAGDSRLYLYRNRRLKLLTRDHNQIEELRSRGELPPEDDFNYPAHNLITRAVGARDYLDLDEDIIKLNDGDMFLLCSDGLSNPVGEEDICAALMPGDCRQAAEELIELALDGGGRDNISVVVVRAEDLYSTDKTVLNPAL